MKKIKVKDLTISKKAGKKVKGGAPAGMKCGAEIMKLGASQIQSTASLVKLGTVQKKCAGMGR